MVVKCYIAVFNKLKKFIEMYVIIHVKMYVIKDNILITVRLSLDAGFCWDTFSFFNSGILPVEGTAQISHEMHPNLQCSLSVLCLLQNTAGVIMLLPFLLI